MGEYENAECTGHLDSSNWVLVQAFGFEASMTFDEDGTFEVSLSALGNTETETGTWSESSDGSLIIDGGYDDEGVFSIDGNTISVIATSDAYCEDEDGEELPEYTDQNSCENAGNDWYEASCTLSEYTKQ